MTKTREWNEPEPSQHAMQFASPDDGSREINTKATPYGNCAKRSRLRGGRGVCFSPSPAQHYPYSETG